jgi:putative ABC transport system permease protein
MIKNYFKIAWRNIVQHKIFSLLNVLGLALSISAGSIILLLYQDGYSYDTFHKDTELIYRVNTIAARKSGATEPYATTPPLVSKILKSQFTSVDEVATLKVLKGEIVKDNETIQFQGKIAEKSFLEIFNFSLESGNKYTALQEPNSIIISSKLSQKLFRNENAMGKIIQTGRQGSYKVTGVLKPDLRKTHFEFEALFSPKHEEQSQENLFDLETTYTYIKVRPHINSGTIAKALNQQLAPQFKNLPFQSPDASYSFELQRLSEITPGYSIANGMGKGLPGHLLRLLALMALVVMASAIFNYTNLTLAKSFRRTKEIGVRKVMGATRKQILVQVISEGILISLVALVVAFVFVAFFRSELNHLQSFQFFDLDVNITPASILYFIIFAIITGAVAGFIPAITMSKLNPVAALRKIENHKIIKRIGLTKMLLVMQFAVSMLFIMIVTTLYKQVKFAVNMDYGFTTDQIYNVQLQGIPADVAKAKFNSLQGVERISAINIPMGTYQESRIAYKVNKTDEFNKIKSYSIDENLIPNLDLSLVSGKNFESKSLANAHRVIVNETFIKNNRMGDASEAIGKEVFLNDSTTATIRAVVKDFLFKPADEALSALMLQYKPAEWELLNIKISANGFEQTKTDLQKAWKEIAPNREFHGELYATTIQNNYAILKDVNKVIQFFALLGIVICLMGLLGMTIYSVEKRQKEVSLRKVLGATEKEIVFTLSKNFAGLLVTGFIISIPSGLFICNLILNNFSNRISAGLNIILPGFILLTLLAIVTIGSQTFNAATANPVKSLRTE